jgi:replication-associated recombination protein RarA
MTDQVIERLKSLRAQRKHLILVIDEVDSFSKSEN